ncbi:hypothetical protein I7I51_06547 [Histoplasma capsulatum]|uniref:Uncharacterized protein n=1 Tax=Ajellomyces capsulatus TaxID=5037 RepID=A0A8A1MIG6_AJECA|nr:predicted protein [Histoplasma mississippiense (nom. inval.)]EDN06165.1 predicted protein [Histoplasma mississippiense (nom. inval.)]QSS65699.1 hypothetical protein I7I51_06547 [Histoplasma capsulatum]
MSNNPEDMTLTSPKPSALDFPTHNSPHHHHHHRHHLSNSAQQQQQQQHNLAVAASAAAASYAADNHLAGLVEAATAAAGQDVDWAQNDEGDASVMAHGRTLHGHLEGYPSPNPVSGASGEAGGGGDGLHLGDGFVGDPTTGGGQGQYGGMPSGAGSGSGSVDGSSGVPTATTTTAAAAAARRQLRHVNVARGPTNLPRKRKRASTIANVDPAMTDDVPQEGHVIGRTRGRGPLRRRAFPPTLGHQQEIHAPADVEDVLVAGLVAGELLVLAGCGKGVYA